MKTKKILWIIFTLAIASSMVLASCAPKDGGDGTGDTGNAEALPQGQELANAYAGMYDGTVVTMSGPFTDQDAVVFEDSIKGFEEATGIDIQYEGSKEFEATINIRLDAGDSPDIADFPQPGLLATAAEKGYVIDPRDVINPDWIDQNYSEAWKNLSMMTGPDGEEMMAGIWARANGKSFVFYPKAAFDEAGYTVPTTWDEMMALTQQIADDGDTAWCIGIESGAATGWTMTDWIEDVLLRVAPPEDYDAWVAGELKFDSPQVNLALDYIEEIWFNNDYVYGGREAIPTINFGDAPKPMFENPPKCWFNRQGNFVTTFFPEEAVAGVDYDFFYFPPINEDYGKPVLGAGDIYAMFNDRPEVRAVFQYFSTGESLKVWIESGGAIGVHNDASLDWYADPITRNVAETIRNATTFRFDGSDLMPGAVGAGTFWKYMTDYVSGTITREEALQQIDASWPTE
ncbi:MAG: carbohydrate ABC transporter substrate-binding protein [Anaerolineaceae bacterium]|jgi:alpha-glucoside transport system substrate-binding protein|nr:carbohydrate ABC transporter substrate-binding protein [Anaerolineaceae bacterium]